MAQSSYPDDIQFAGLVQAATAAADEQTRNATTNLGKRKRRESDDDNDEGHIHSSHDPAEHTEGNGVGQGTVQLQSSATVLFREPSEKSRKYSRPPLGKVYASLELAPEVFLRLQAAAKDFMLHPDHPERRDVVGHKKQSSGNDVSKLKLWNCVEDFMGNYGNGDKFFGRRAGAGIPDAPPRTIFWPDNSDRITKLVMPLMRKMVTNERQRLYAAESRGKTTARSTPEREISHSIEPASELDPRITDSHDGLTVELPGQTAPTTTDDHAEMATISSGKGASKSAVTIYVNLTMFDGSNYRRIMPRFSLVSNQAKDLKSLLREVEKRYAAKRHDNSPNVDDFSTAKTRVWLPDGLVPVKDDGEWMVALLSAEMVEWMDGEVRVVLEV